MVPDLQCAWQILLQSANPRCNHLPRTLRPSESGRYARAHDRGMWQTLQELLGTLPGTASDLLTASTIATLPMRLGGLGLRSAARTAPAAYWGSWADALKQIADRSPMAVSKMQEQLESEVPQGQSIQELINAKALLQREGFLRMPSWRELCERKRPEPSTSTEPGDWPHD